MAARTKDSAHGKEKAASLSHSQVVDISHGKRTPKPSIAVSPDKGSSLLAEKPKPNYLKPTISSGHEACKYVKKQTSESQAPKRLVHKSSLDKPHSSTSQPQKTQVLVGFREKPTKISSPTTKTATYVRAFLDKETSSSKTVSDKATKTVRNGKTQPSTKPKIIKRESCFPRKRENKTPSTVTTAHQETEKPPSICDEQEEKETENVEVQGFKVEDESVEYEPETPENENAGALEFVTTLEEHSEHSKTEVEGLKDNEIDEDNRDKQNGEQRTTDQHDDGHNTRNSEENGIVDEEQPQKNEDEEPKSSEENKVTMDTQEEQTVHNSEKAKEVTDKEYENEGIEKITFKEREVGEMAEVTNPMPDSTSPKKNEEKVKKDSPDYNDVIEETASKPVEKRKNRVLALAGAFETAINLHESTVKGSKGRE
ncbi:uncharacterized protein [Aristolochia californica]|uniref:uncharacterized protein n=1 Tax=Aristolochia californica TaxID=171875 RepID=UPI0035DFF06E